MQEAAAILKTTILSHFLELVSEKMLILFLFYLFIIFFPESTRRLNRLTNSELKVHGVWGNLTFGANSQFLLAEIKSFPLIRGQNFNHFCLEIGHINICPTVSASEVLKCRCNIQNLTTYLDKKADTSPVCLNRD